MKEDMPVKTKMSPSSFYHGNNEFNLWLEASGDRRLSVTRETQSEELRKPESIYLSLQAPTSLLED